MTDIVFGRLQDLSPREAWRYEADAFTPWLAENIDHLSEAIGIPLELTGTEVAVETFSADILARNPDDGGVVLIENQLEATDHTHLGQIMTYLAGLEAKTVVWISPRFREPHLSAIRWLNEHTPDNFAFFGVRLRVVRIGDSPYAPVFEVVEKPSEWERQLGATSRSVRAEPPAASLQRRSFWQKLLDRHPDLAEFGLRESAESNRWLDSPLTGVLICPHVATRECGVYVRGPAETPIESVAERLAPFAEQLEARVGAPFQRRRDRLLAATVAYPFADEESWPAMFDWLADRLRLYFSTFAELADRSTA